MSRFNISHSGNVKLIHYGINMRRCEIVESNKVENYTEPSVRNSRVTASTSIMSLTSIFPHKEISRSTRAAAPGWFSIETSHAWCREMRIFCSYQLNPEIVRSSPNAINCSIYNFLLRPISKSGLPCKMLKKEKRSGICAELLMPHTLSFNCHQVSRTQVKRRR